MTLDVEQAQVFDNFELTGQTDQTDQDVVIEPEVALLSSSNHVSSVERLNHSNLSGEETEKYSGHKSLVSVVYQK